MHGNAEIHFQKCMFTASWPGGDLCSCVVQGPHEALGASGNIKRFGQTLRWQDHASQGQAWGVLGNAWG